MIFVTVGTDEHPFFRLLIEIERLVKEGIIKEKVIVQSGHTDFTSSVIEEIYPMLPYGRFLEFIRDARIVVTHAGPGSIMLALNSGKIPVVVPRRKEFGEHVDNHQVRFTEFLEKKGKIFPVYEIEKLKDVIINYEKNLEGADIPNVEKGFLHAKRFSENLEKLIEKLMGGEK